MRLLLRSLWPLVALLQVIAVAGHAQDTQSYRGRSVQSVIDELRERGVPLAYSSNLLPDSLRVLETPASTVPLELARAVLAPHGLTLEERGGVWLVVRAVAPPAAGGLSVTVTALGSGAAIPGASLQVDAAGSVIAAGTDGQARLEGLSAGRHAVMVWAPGYLPARAVVTVAAGGIVPMSVVLAPARPALDQLTVTASRYDLLRTSQPSLTYFSQAEIERLSDFGNDTLRVVQRLPGMAASEFSSRTYVRGGASDETVVMLDGIELVEPFHLSDYQGVFSAIDDRIVGGMRVYSGGFPAEYGGALSGLTLIDRRKPTEPLYHELGLSLLYTSVLSSGTFSAGRGSWLAAARRGNTELLLRDDAGEPSYSDVFIHVDRQLVDKHRVGFSMIGFNDDVIVTPKNAIDDLERGTSDVSSRQLWVELTSDWSAALSSRTLIHTTRFDHARQGEIAALDSMIASASDTRSLDSDGFKQDWRFDSESQALTWGLERAEVAAHFVYASSVELRGVLGTLAAEPVASRAAVLAPESRRYAAYVSDRVRLSDRWIADVGLRWDRSTHLVDDDQFSPRSSVLYRVGARTDLRISVGRFFQTERLIDLQIEDGVLEYAPAQNATHSIVGVEHRFQNAMTLRTELFRKWTRSARPRFENLFDPLVLLPELQPDRIRIAPRRAETQGLELFLSGEEPVSWWVGFTLSHADDRIDERHVPRSWDQRRALTGAVTWRAGPWTLDGGVTAHSGWPTTSLALELDGSGEAIAVPGLRNAERLPSLRRLDFSAARDFTIAVGSVRFFVELTNVTNRANVCCSRYDATTLTGGAVVLERAQRRGLPLFANVGALWSF